MPYNNPNARTALLAGLGADIWPTPDALPPLPGSYKHFDPTLNDRQRDEGYQRWQQTIALVSTWGRHNDK
jgi:glycerol kinase